MLRPCTEAMCKYDNKTIVSKKQIAKSLQTHFRHENHNIIDQVPFYNIF